MARNGEEATIVCWGGGARDGKTGEAGADLHTFAWVGTCLIDA